MHDLIEKYKSTAIREILSVSVFNLLYGHGLFPPNSVQSFSQHKAVPPAHCLELHKFGWFFGHLTRPPLSLQHFHESSPYSLPSPLHLVPSSHSNWLSSGFTIGTPLLARHLHSCAKSQRSFIRMIEKKRIDITRY